MATTVASPTDRGAEARVSLVAAAERLFAEHGIMGVSLRDVSKAAGQRNNSAAQYHFGDRHGLVAAVYVSHMVGVDERRSAHLVELDPAERDPRALVHAIVAPLVEEVTTSGGWYARFLVRARWEPIGREVVAELETTGALVEVGNRMSRVMADLPDPIRQSRLDQLYNLIVGTLASWEWAHDRDEQRLTPEELIDELTTTGAAVLLAASHRVELETR